MKRSVVLIFSLLVSCAVFAQEERKPQVEKPLPTLNSSLSSDEQVQVQAQAEVAARQLMNHLQAGNLQAAEAFYPSKEVYIEMAKNQGFKSKDDLQEAVIGIQRHYEREKTRVLATFQNVAEQCAAQGTMSFSYYHFVLQQNSRLRGGKGAIVMKDASGQEHAVTYYKFFEFEGQWYVVSKLKWQF